VLQVEADFGLHGDFLIEDLNDVIICGEGGSARFVMPPKEPWGILVISLPVGQQNGVVTVRQGGDQMVALPIGNSQVSTVRHVAFPSGCAATLDQGNGGVFLVYVLNKAPPRFHLFQVGDKGREEEKEEEKEDHQEAVEVNPQTIPIPGLVEKISTELCRVLGGADPPKKLVYLLPVGDTPRDVAYENLEPGDLAVADTLEEAAELAGCVVSLAVIRLYQKENDSKTWEGMADNVRCLRGRIRGLGQLVVAEGEVFPNKHLRNVRDDLYDPDCYFSSTFGYTRSFAGLLIWRKDCLIPVAFQNPVGRVAELLRPVVVDMSKEHARQLLLRISPAANTAPHDLEPVIRLLQDMGEKELLYDLLDRFVEVGRLGHLGGGLLLALPHVDLQKFLKLVKRMQERFISDLDPRYAGYEPATSKLVEGCEKILGPGDPLEDVKRTIGTGMLDLARTPSDMNLIMAWMTVGAINHQETEDLLLDIVNAPGNKPQTTAFVILDSIQRRSYSTPLNARAIKLWKRTAEAVLEESEHPPGELLKGKHYLNNSYYKSKSDEMHKNPHVKNLMIMRRLCNMISPRDLPEEDRDLHLRLGIACDLWK